MVLQTEQANLPVGAAKRLAPVEDRLPVMQHASSRIHGERRVGDDARVVPALPLVVLHHEHVVGEDRSERQRLIGRGLFGRGGAGDGDLGHFFARAFWVGRWSG